MASLEGSIAFLIIFASIIPLIIFILSKINSNVETVSTILEEISSSLNDYPISNLNYAEYCNSNEYNGYLFTFPGSVSGCSCANVHKYYYEQSGQNEVTIGTCKYNQTLNGCEDVKAIPSMKLDAWNKKKFCCKKYNLSTSFFKGYLYFLNNSVLENEECKSGYKKCGKLDDMGNYLCFPENEECPINDVISSRTKREDLENKNYSFITVNDNMYLYYSNQEKDKSVISKFKVVEGKLCADRAYVHSDYPQYILDKQFEFYGCRHKINDQLYEDYVELDSMTKWDFYKSSELVLNNLQYYHNSSFEYPFYSLEANVSLYPERYIGYDKKCLMENDALNLENVFSEEKVDEMNQVITNALYTNSFTEWFSIIFLIVEILSCNCNPLFSEFSVSSILLWAFRNILYYAGMAVPLYINISEIKQFTEFPLCGSALINAKINYYNSTGKTLKTKIIWAIILVNIQLAIIIIILILRCFIHCEIFHENRAPLIGNQKSSDIDYEKNPEEAYYNCPDFKNNNPTPSADFINNVDNNNLQGNNMYINPNSVSSGTDNPNSP